MYFSRVCADLCIRTVQPKLPMPAMNKPILMRFPLIGEWNTPNTPGSRIPSHGTNALGTRYAYDFLQLNWKKRGDPCYRSHVLSYLLFGVTLSSCYCYGLPVYAPCDGRVVYVMDGCRERKRAWFFSDALMAFKNSRRRSWTVLIFCMRTGFPVPLPNMRCWKTDNGTLYTEVSPQHSSGYAMPR